jgi:hypothetical protein
MESFGPSPASPNLFICKFLPIYKNVYFLTAINAQNSFILQLKNGEKSIFSLNFTERKETNFQANSKRKHLLSLMPPHYLIDDDLPLCGYIRFFVPPLPLPPTKEFTSIPVPPSGLFIHIPRDGDDFPQQHVPLLFIHFIHLAINQKSLNSLRVD